MSEIEQTTTATQEAAQTETETTHPNAINTEVHKDEKQNDIETGVQTLEIKKDIYNTFAILRATMVSTEKGPQSIWQARFSPCDRAIFYFFLCLIVIIQVGGFFILYNDATDFALENLYSEGTQVYLDSGVVDFTLLNALNATNYTMAISYADLSLLDTDPTEPADDVDLSVLFSQLVADVCIVLYLFKGLNQTGQLVTLSRHLPYYHKQRWLVTTLTITKCVVLIWGSFASLGIIALARTSIEAFEKAIAVFFLVETSEWVYGVIRAHPEIHDKLYEIKVDFTSTIGGDEENAEDEIAKNELKQYEYQIYRRMMAKNAFANVFIQTVVFLFLYIGMQFAMFLDYAEFFVVIIVGFVLAIYFIMRTKRDEKEAKRLAKQQASLQMTVNDSDYH